MRLAKALLTFGLLRPTLPPQTFSFAGVRWGDSPTVVETKLRAEGFAIAGHDGADVAFRGRVAGYDGEGWIYFASGHAVKALFIVSPPPAQVMGTYDRLRSWVTRQYGSTRHQ